MRRHGTPLCARFARRQELRRGSSGRGGSISWPSKGRWSPPFFFLRFGGRPPPTTKSAAGALFPPHPPLPSNLLLEHRQRLVDTLNLAPDQETLLAIPDGLSAPEEIRRWRARHG